MMNNHRIFYKGLMFFLCAFSTAYIHAESNFDFDKPWYLGVQINHTEITLREGSRTTATATEQFSADNSDVAQGLVLGMHYWPHVDIELRYENLGTFEQSMRYKDASRPVEVDVKNALDYSSFSAVLKPRYHMFGGFEAQAELGVAVVKGERKPSITVKGTQTPDDLAALQADIESSIDGASSNETVLVYGVGIQYRFKNSSPWLWRYHLRRTRHNDEELGVSALSVARLFQTKVE